ncbi:MAG: efflux transporter periplasmic adaptor subunit, partial [Bacteroidales bacterium]|nr:efflux transporter periplasmic adaptor subunit [Bacteroidales bacterium]
MKTYIISLFIIVAVLFTACNSRQKKDNLSSTGKQEHYDYGGKENEYSNKILFTKEQAKLAGLTTETISKGTFFQILKTSGQIQASQGDEVTIVATSNGTVSFTNPSITDGSYVS